MSTITPPRPPTPPTARPAPASGMPPTVDPVRLLKKYKWLLVVAAVVGAIAGAATYVVWLRVAPSWTAEATFQCTPPKDEFGLRGNRNDEDELERFMQSQAQYMTFDTVLQAAAERPEFRREAPNWSKQFSSRGNFSPSAAAEALKDDVRARVLPNTQYIRLSMTSPNRQEATAILGCIREAYMAALYRDKNTWADSEKKSIRDQMEAAKKARDMLTKRLQDRQEDYSPDALEADRSTAHASFTQTAAMISNLKESLNRVNEQLNHLEQQLSANAFSDTIRSEIEQAPLILNIQRTINELEAERRAMSERLTDRHRYMIDLANRIAGQRLTLEQERERLLHKMRDSQLELLKIERNSLLATLEELTEKNIQYEARLSDLVRLEMDNKRDEDQIAIQQKTITDLEEKLGSIVAMQNNPDFYRVTVVQQEQVPLVVSWPKSYVLIPMGVILVTGLVAGGVFLREMLDQRVKTPGDITMIPRAKVLTIIPHADEDPGAPASATAFRDAPKSATAEHIRQLRAIVIQKARHGEHKTILVAGGMPGSGATSITANLGMALAASSQRVLLIDANFRRPALHSIFDLPEEPGLADVLAGDTSIMEAARGSGENLWVLTRGVPRSSEFEKLGTDTMSRILEEAKTHYDVILLDAAPAVVSGDVASLANRVDATMLVTRAYAEKRGMVARLVADFSGRKSEFMGVVVNGVRGGSGGYFRSNFKAARDYNAPAA